MTKPFLQSEEMQIVQQPLKSGWIVQGKYVEEFERRFSRFIEYPYCIATSSCTSALHVAMIAMDVRSGDEVIVPAFTWVTTPNAVEYEGGKPIFCDIRMDTFNIDENQIERHITPRTVGIIPVHLFGLCAEMRSIRKIASKHNLWIVEDAACAVGGWYEGTHAGTLGDMGCFSFHPRKVVTTGEGGMVVTHDKEKEVLCRTLINHGSPDFSRLGYNYRMTDIQGAIGCIQMDKAYEMLGERIVKSLLYNKMLEEAEWVRTPVVPDGCVHSYQSYVCLLSDCVRDEVIENLQMKGIHTVKGTHAPVDLPYYRKKYGLSPNDFPNAIKAEKYTLTLPLYVGMKEGEQEQVVEELQKCRGN